MGHIQSAHTACSTQLAEKERQTPGSHCKGRKLGSSETERVRLPPSQLCSLAGVENIKEGRCDKLVAKVKTVSLRWLGIGQLGTGEPMQPPPRSSRLS